MKIKFYCIKRFILLTWIYLCIIDGFSSEPNWVITEKTAIFMGTVFNIKIVSSDSDEILQKANETIEKAFLSIKNIEAEASVYNENSYVSLINKNAGIRPVIVSVDFFKIIKDSIKISKITNGAFDISFESFLNIWKINAENIKIPQDIEINNMLDLVSYKKIKINNLKRTIFLSEKGMKISLGGIAKGTSVDRASNEIRKNGFKNYLIDGGGDIYAAGYRNPETKQNWIIGIKHPRNNNQFIMKVIIKDKAIATSGDYEKKVDIQGKRYHHIFDPRTGSPANECISATVISNTCQYADALATGFFVLGADKSCVISNKLKNTDCMLISYDEKIVKSKNFDKFIYKDE